MLELETSEIQSLATGNFELPLSSIKLRRNNNSKESESGGTGLVRQSGNGKLQLVMFITSNPPNSWEVLHELQDRGTSGQFFRDDDYYSIEAWDFRGRQWSAERLLPDFSILSKGEVSSCMAEAEVTEIAGVSYLGLPIPRADWELKIWYRGAIQFPFTSKVTSENSTKERIIETSWSYAASEFAERDWTFFVAKEGEFLTIKVSSASTPFPEGLEYCLEQALEFVLAQRLSWALVRRRLGDEVTYLVTDALLNRTQPRWVRRPVDFKKGGSGPESHAAVDLFRLYLKKVLGGDPGKIPSISVAVRMTLEGDGSPLESYGLQLAVAVEKLLAELPKSKSSADEHFILEVDRVREAVSASEISETAKTRIFGALARLGGRSPVDKLHELKAISDIEEEEIAAWKSVRHGLAHGAPWRLDQASYDNIRKTMLLFYKIMFYLLEYTGPYRDYGKHGWPWQRLEK